MPRMTARALGRGRLRLNSGASVLRIGRLYSPVFAPHGHRAPRCWSVPGAEQDRDAAQVEPSGFVDRTKRADGPCQTVARNLDLGPRRRCGEITEVMFRLFVALI